ncbi:DUF6119 family protein [Enterococcus faecalis]
MKVTLYKILFDKREEFLAQLKKEYKNERTIQKGYKEKSLTVTLYIDDQEKSGPPNWQWVVDELESDINLTMRSAPKGIVIIDVDDEQYALSFSYAYHCVSKYADKDFAFSFARKIDFKEIKRTAKVAPHSSKNKMVDAFKDNRQFIFDSGEAYLKINLVEKLPKGFGIYKPNIEIGDALTVDLVKNCLESIFDLIFHVKQVIDSDKAEQKIPILKKIGKEDPIKLERLDNNLLQKINDSEMKIYLSDFDIVGNVEEFKDYSNDYSLHYKRKKEIIKNLEIETIRNFIEKHEIKGIEVFNIKIGKFIDNKIIKYTLKEILDYTDEDEHCTLFGGDWYSYNLDYLDYLKESLAEIPVVYYPEYDFSLKKHENYCSLKYEQEKQNKRYQGKTEEQIKKSIKNRYYKEFFYNTWLAETNSHFKNYDTKLAKLPDKTVIEVADIHCQASHTLFAVKIGNTSSKLSYAITQSIASLEAIKIKSIKFEKDLDRIGLWIVLDMKNKLPEVESGKPDINALEMFVFKNYLDSWKKFVLHQSKQPILHINYITD